ncbi:hypothetical protein [Ottowia thiooxydans]|uniref:Uncharacterized protein n=1 Tax=Ottowia thiooxydans TaxID=219182 RepID=A0ABV2QHT6_9BURK
MSSSNRTLSYEDAIAQAEMALQETDKLFEEHGIDPGKARAYFASVTTPEIRAQAEAAFNADMQALHQEVRDLLKSTATTRTKTRRQMV